MYVIIEYVSLSKQHYVKMFFVLSIYKIVSDDKKMWSWGYQRPFGTDLVYRDDIFVKYVMKQYSLNPILSFIKSTSSNKKNAKILRYNR